MPHHSGEGMTDSPPGGLSTSRDTGAGDHDIPTGRSSRSRHLRQRQQHALSHPPASRTYGRCAVGLRPILDPGARLNAPKTRAEQAKRKDHGDQDSG